LCVALRVAVCVADECESKRCPYSEREAVEYPCVRLLDHQPHSRSQPTRRECFAIMAYICFVAWHVLRHAETRPNIEVDDLQPLETCIQRQAPILGSFSISVDMPLCHYSLAVFFRREFLSIQKE
jgi:hypothetical protein